MKQGTVKFSKEFITPIGLKEWAGIELEYDMNTECPQEVLTNAREIITGWHMSGSPGIPDNSIPPGPPPIIQVKPEDREIGLTPDQILSCNDLIVLETYRWLIKGKPELERAYFLRHDQLNDAIKNK